MDLKTIKNLLSLIADSDVDEVSIEEGDFKIKVKKKAEVEQQNIPQMPIQYQMPAQQPQAPSQPQQPQQTGGGAPQQESAEKEEAQPEGNVIKSPIVGTFYRSPSPDEDPFVKVGDQVEKGQTVCIIEAMKIMNEIESEFSGEIKKILVEDAEPVEYDQPLFIIG